MRGDRLVVSLYIFLRPIIKLLKHFRVHHLSVVFNRLERRPIRKVGHVGFH